MTRHSKEPYNPWSGEDWQDAARAMWEQIHETSWADLAGQDRAEFCAEMIPVLDALAPRIAEREQAARDDAVQAVREFAWGLGAATATKTQILDALTRQPFAPAGDRSRQDIDE